MAEYRPPLGQTTKDYSVPTTTASDETPYPLSVSIGLVPNTSGVNKFGANPDIDSGAGEDVWDGGNTSPEWVPPTAARIHDMVSTSANDIVGGTGLRSAGIFGTDANFDLINEPAPLATNGLVNVPTTLAYTSIFRAFGEEFGSLRTNAGDITFTAQGDLTLTAQISAGKGQTLMAIYTVPRLHTLYITAWGGDSIITAGGGLSSADLTLFVAENIDTPTWGWRVRDELASTAPPHVYNPPLGIPGPAHIRVFADNLSANNSRVKAFFDGVLIQNTV